MKTEEEVIKYCKTMGYSEEYAKFWSKNRYCKACGHYSAAPHHIITRGSRGNLDQEWNLLNLCYHHHRLIHKIGNKTFTELYPVCENKINKAKETLYGRHK